MNNISDTAALSTKFNARQNEKSFSAMYREEMVATLFLVYKNSANFTQTHELRGVDYTRYAVFANIEFVWEFRKISHVR